MWSSIFYWSYKSGWIWLVGVLCNQFFKVVQVNKSIYFCSAMKWQEICLICVTSRQVRGAGDVWYLKPFTQFVKFKTRNFNKLWELWAQIVNRLVLKDWNSYRNALCSQQKISLDLLTTLLKKAWLYGVTIIFISSTTFSSLLTFF